MRVREIVAFNSALLRLEWALEIVTIGKRRYTIDSISKGVFKCGRLGPCVSEVGS